MPAFGAQPFQSKYSENILCAIVFILTPFCSASKFIFSRVAFSSLKVIFSLSVALFAANTSNSLAYYYSLLYCKRMHENVVYPLTDLYLDLQLMNYKVLLHNVIQDEKVCIILISPFNGYARLRVGQNAAFFILSAIYYGC